MRRRFIPINVIIIAGLLVLLSLGPDQYKPPKEVMGRGKILFERECMLCHQPESPDKEAALHPTAQWVFGTKKKLIKAVLNGLPDSAQMNENTQGNLMPSFQHLNDEQVSDVLTYIRNSFDNKAVAITPAEVKKVRALNARKAKKK